VAYKSSDESMQFALYFECLALFANASRRIGAIVANAIKNQHISRSYYVWLAIYVAVAIMFIVANKIKKSHSAKQKLSN
jgi:flagellar biosynthesis protein FliR